MISSSRTRTCRCSPLLSTRADADSTAVARRGVVAGPLPHFEPDAAAAAALVPRAPGSPAAVPEQRHRDNPFVSWHGNNLRSHSPPGEVLKGRRRTVGAIRLFLDSESRRSAPGTVCHLDGRAFAVDPAAPGLGSVARAGPTHAAADGALAVVVVTGLPRRPRAKTAILCQVPHLRRRCKGVINVHGNNATYRCPVVANNYNSVAKHDKQIIINSLIDF